MSAAVSSRFWLGLRVDGGGAAGGSPSQAAGTESEIWWCAGRRERICTSADRCGGATVVWSAIGWFGGSCHYVGALTAMTRDFALARDAPSISILIQPLPLPCTLNLWSQIIRPITTCKFFEVCCQFAAHPQATHHLQSIMESRDAVALATLPPSAAYLSRTSLCR